MKFRLRRSRSKEETLRDLADRRPEQAEKYLNAHHSEWEQIAEQTPHDAADILEALDEEGAADLLGDIDTLAAAANVLDEMRPEAAADVIEELAPGDRRSSHRGDGNRPGCGPPWRPRVRATRCSDRSPRRRRHDRSHGAVGPPAGQRRRNDDHRDRHAPRRDAGRRGRRGPAAPPRPARIQPLVRLRGRR